MSWFQFCGSELQTHTSRNLTDWSTCGGAAEDEELNFRRTVRLKLQSSEAAPLLTGPAAGLNFMLGSFRFPRNDGGAAGEVLSVDPS